MFFRDKPFISTLNKWLNRLYVVQFIKLGPRETPIFSNRHCSVSRSHSSVLFFIENVNFKNIFYLSCVNWCGYISNTFWTRSARSTRSRCPGLLVSWRIHSFIRSICYKECYIRIICFTSCSGTNRTLTSSFQSRNNTVNK